MVESHRGAAARALAAMLMELTAAEAGGVPRVPALASEDGGVV